MNVNNKSLNCPFCCNETFDCLNDLKKHILQIINKLNCPICKKNFDNLNNFSSHLMNCDVSSTQSSTAKEPKDNVVELQDTSENTQFYCEICDVYFEEMRRHLIEHHVGQEVVVESRELDRVLHDSVVGVEGASDGSTQYIKPLIDTPDLEQILVEQEVLDETGKFLTKKITKINIVQEPTKKIPIVEYVNFCNTVTNTITEEGDKDVENSMKVYRCPNCDLKFAHINIFAKHVCNSKDGIICEICYIHFGSKGSLTYHKRKLHKDIKLLKEKISSKCEICHIEFPSSNCLKMHLKMHSTIEQRRKIDSLVTYNNSGEKISDDDNEMFICKVCGEEYNKKFEEIHMKSHVEETFNCVICNRKFDDKIDLNIHTQAHVNDGDRKISCRFCKKMFKSKELLERHTVNACGARKYSCNYCGKKFSTPHEMVKHERVHTGLKPFVCELCGKRFRVSYCLTLHLRTHSGVRPYHCETCGKRFKSHSSYSNHIQTHSEEKKYKCPFCPKAFKTAVQQIAHKKWHTKPFSCNICSRPFPSLYDVRVHRKIHDRKKGPKYTCHICGANYARNVGLRDHIMTHPEHTEEDLLKVQIISSAKENENKSDRDSDSKVVIEVVSKMGNISKSGDTDDSRA